MSSCPYCINSEGFPIELEEEGACGVCGYGEDE